TIRHIGAVTSQAYSDRECWESQKGCLRSGEHRAQRQTAQLCCADVRRFAQGTRPAGWLAPRYRSPWLGGVRVEHGGESARRHGTRLQREIGGDHRERLEIPDRPMRCGASAYTTGRAADPKADAEARPGKDLCG